jgi:hypothetical protein
MWLQKQSILRACVREEDAGGRGGGRAIGPENAAGSVCECLLLQDLVQSCLHGGGGGYGRTCATRDDEPRPVWTRLPITH